MSVHEYFCARSSCCHLPGFPPPEQDTTGRKANTLPHYTSWIVFLDLHVLELDFRGVCLLLLLADKKRLGKEQKSDSFF
jgi:hypothetical protein